MSANEHELHAELGAARDLGFGDLRKANLLRSKDFTSRQGQPLASSADGSPWRLSQWSNATLGELGEAASVIKQIERGDRSLEEARPDLARELADVVTYLDLLAAAAGIDLAQATRSKFNEVSRRVGSPVRL